MEKFTTLTGIAAPLPHANLDTDQLMPKQFLKGIDRRGLANGFLFDLRFEAPGRKRPDFVLNREPWTQSSILVTGPNFGCGSSREHAVWGLRDLGLRCVIGTSFGGIFSDNCARNGVLAITVPPPEVDRLMAQAADPGQCRMTIDLEHQTITSDGDGCVLWFETDPLRRHMLLNGLDVVGLTLEHASQIRDFESSYFAAHDWLA